VGDIAVSYEAVGIRALMDFSPNTFRSAGAPEQWCATCWRGVIARWTCSVAAATTSTIAATAEGSDAASAPVRLTSPNVPLRKLPAEQLRPDWQRSGVCQCSPLWSNMRQHGGSGVRSVTRGRRVR